MKNSWQSWAALTAIILGVAAGVTAHFDGINAAKTYTDTKMDGVEVKLDKIDDKISAQSVDIAEIKTMIKRK